MRDEAIETFDKRPRAVVLGCAGERLSPAETRFFAAADPLGFVLFGRDALLKQKEAGPPTRRGAGPAPTGD